MNIENIEQSVFKITDFYFEKESQYEYIISLLSIAVFAITLILAMTKIFDFNEIFIASILACCFVGAFSGFYLFKLNRKTSLFIQQNLPEEKVSALVHYLENKHTFLSNKRAKRLEPHITNLKNKKDNVTIDLLLPLVAHIKKIEELSKKRTSGL